MRRVRELADRYEPPAFAHVPDPDAALFLCAVDHRTGYRRAHVVAGEGPFSGSALLWAVALEAARRQPGLLTAGSLRNVGAATVAELFRIDAETVTDAERRAALLRDTARGLERDHGGQARALLHAAGGSLGGEGGLLELLARYEAYSDPLHKKSFLFAKICERRGWFSVDDPEHWEVCADNVLMRLALRSGLVAPGPLDAVRAAHPRCLQGRCRALADVAAGARRPLVGARARRSRPPRDRGRRSARAAAQSGARLVLSAPSRRTLSRRGAVASLSRP